MDTGFVKTQNILVVEDDPIMLKAIYNILNKGGYSVTAAKDAKEAFEYIENDTYDLVITDLMLPYANGIELVRRIRMDGSKKNVGIVVISSMGTEDLMAEAYEYGVDIYFKKPIMPSEFLLRIRKLLSDKNFIPGGAPALVTADFCTDTFSHSGSGGLYIRKYRTAR